MEHKLNTNDCQRKFNSFKTYTKSDADKVMKNKGKILKLAENEKLLQYIDDIKLYFLMLGDVFTGKYKKLPIGTVAAIVGTLLYVLMPQDLIPDYIPGIGFLDDATILGLCLNFTRYDVEQYKKNKELLPA